MKNKNRGCSFVFGRQAAVNLMEDNNLISIIRGHEVQFEGFKFYDWLDQGFPQVINVFSAANYCEKYNNKGAIITLDVGSLE
jgi:serine/threonine-protein phosphatase 2B catalytic subunit